MATDNKTFVDCLGNVVSVNDYIAVSENRVSPKTKEKFPEFSVYKVVEIYDELYETLVQYDASKVLPLAEAFKPEDYVRMMSFKDVLAFDAYRVVKVTVPKLSPKNE
jgi:hypothetical protein